MNPQKTAGGNVDRNKMSALLEQFKALQTRIAGKGSFTENRQLSEILDELQELTGLAGKIVTERDIIRQAEKLLATP